MRPSNKPATMGELLGAEAGAKAQAGQDFGLDSLPSLLGEKMPKMEFTRVGRIRLVNALEHRFGSGWRNIQGISNIVKEFDKNMEASEVVRANKGK